MMKKLLIILLWSFLSIQAQENFIVIALGESCGVTAALEIFDLKKASYPYEWCITPFDGLYKSLKNDFSDFTNPAYFTPYVDNRSPVNKYGIVLAHDFPVVKIGVDSAGNDKYVLDPEWPKLMPKVQEKYQRRIDRFHAACTSGKKVYFVRHIAIMPDMATQLSKLLRSLYPKLDFTILCVRNSPPDIGIWNIPHVKNYYVDTTAAGGDASEWKRIFTQAGVLPAKKQWDNQEIQKQYKQLLCGDCPYCTELAHRQQ